jgi:hypothetical protein
MSIYIGIQSIRTAVPILHGVKIAGTDPVGERQLSGHSEFMEGQEVVLGRYALCKPQHSVLLCVSQSGVFPLSQEHAGPLRGISEILLLCLRALSTRERLQKRRL